MASPGSTSPMDRRHVSDDLLIWDDPIPKAPPRWRWLKRRRYERRLRVWQDTVMLFWSNEVHRTRPGG